MFLVKNVSFDQNKGYKSNRINSLTNDTERVKLVINVSFHCHVSFPL